MKEPDSNIAPVCPDHAPKPDLVWTGKKPEFFIGKFVKKGFPTPQPMLRVEHMWVKVTAVKDGKLVGELNNDPIASLLRCGDIVEVALDEIEQVME